MARRRPSLLGIVGSLLMAASLALEGQPISYVSWSFLMAALALLLSLGYPTWAWVPASVWLIWAVAGLTRYATTGASLGPFWFGASVGGGCVFVGSWLARRRARPQTDVSAFE